jgi:hypothetical protein
MSLNKVLKVAVAGLVATQVSLMATDVSFAAPAGTSFGCKQLLSDPSGSPFATFAVLPDGSKTVGALLNWRTEEFARAGYTPERRCHEVTNRLNIAVNNVGGQLSNLWLTFGRINGYTVLCYVNNTSLGCNSSNVLWTLNSENEATPNQVMAKLVNFVTTKGTSGVPIQESGGQSYVNLGELVDAAISAGTTSPSVSSPKPNQSSPVKQPIGQPSSLTRPSRNGGI